uniref:Uncharacterized protein n=1 Tax=Cacopsylla melanoneura TaxID=428564 RepID=A0A8D8VP34_9HEMI
MQRALCMYIPILVYKGTYCIPTSIIVLFCFGVLFCFVFFFLRDVKLSRLEVYCWLLGYPLHHESLFFLNLHEYMNYGPGKRHGIKKVYKTSLKTTFFTIHTLTSSRDLFNSQCTKNCIDQNDHHTIDTYYLYTIQYIDTILRNFTQFRTTELSRYKLF